MKIVTYEIELVEPCLVTSLQGDPNSAVAFDYLPGAVLRGAIIDRYIRQERYRNKRFQFDAAAAQSQTLFLNGETRYLNAYPLTPQSQRTLPTPRAWHVLKKPKTKAVANIIHDFAVVDTSKDQPDEEWKVCGFPFTWIQDDTIAYDIEPERHMAIHIARDRQRSRDKNRQSERDVYRYESLAAGQRFGGVILCKDESVAATLTSLLPGIIALGGSRSGGYGRIAIHNVKSHDQWREIPGSLQEQGNIVTITLLSDTLIRDKQGQFVVTPNALGDVLSEQLNCSFNLVRAYYQATPVGGFNRKWGLPLPQAMAFVMGGVFVFAAAPTLDQLQTLETEGIGERRGEGFGRLVVNMHSEETLTRRDAPETKVTTVTLAPQSDAGNMAQDLVTRLLRQKLEALMDEKSDNLGKQLRGIKKSQLYALRQVLQSALLQSPDDGRQTVIVYVQHALKRRISREQLERVRIEGDNLADWLTKRATDEFDIWNRNTYLKLDSLPQIGGIKAVLTPALAYEYNLRFADAVLARAARVNGQGGGNE